MLTSAQPLAFGTDSVSELKIYRSSSNYCTVYVTAKADMGATQKKTQGLIKGSCRLSLSLSLHRAHVGSENSCSFTLSVRMTIGATAKEASSALACCCEPVLVSASPELCSPFSLIPSLPAKIQLSSSSCWACPELHVQNGGSETSFDLPVKLYVIRMHLCCGSSPRGRLPTDLSHFPHHIESLRMCNCGVHTI